MPNSLKKENRQFPRIKTRIPLHIINQNGEALFATALDMSLDGLQIECDHKTQQQIIQGNEKQTPGQPVEMDIQIKIPITKNSSTRMEMRCRLVIARRLAQNKYHLGLNYLQLDDTDKLVTFLDNQKSKIA